MLIHRFRLGVQYTQRSLCRIRQVNAQECEFGYPVEDIHHIVIEFSRYAPHMKDLEP